MQYSKRPAHRSAQRTADGAGRRAQRERNGRPANVSVIRVGTQACEVAGLKPRDEILPVIAVADVLQKRIDANDSRKMKDRHRRRTDQTPAIRASRKRCVRPSARKPM